METDMKKLKEKVQLMEETYAILQEISNANDYVLCKVYGMSNMKYIIQDNSLWELYEKWLLYKKEEK